MDDLEELLLAGATNIDGSEVVQLTVELESLNCLNVAGLWESFDAGSQSSLHAWDTVADNTLITASIPGDANRDGKVDTADAAIFATNWQTASGASWKMGDFNNDGMVNDEDATLLAANWQTDVSSAVPEPSTLSILLALGCIAMVRRRRR